MFLIFRGLLSLQKLASSELVFHRLETSLFVQLVLYVVLLEGLVGG
jgi:hypothetical protein